MSRRDPRPIVKPANPMKTLMRIMSYMTKNKFQLILVVILVLLCSGAQVAGNYFLKPIINDYIAPMIGVAPENRVYSGLIAMLVQLVIIYLVGVASGYAYKYIMMGLSNRALRDIRTDLFNKLQDLPIKYYDVNAHGDIMSVYTNDIDTLRQMVSQSMPQMVNSVITIVTVFVSMCTLSIPLTIVTVLVVIVSINVSKYFAGYSSRYFLAQQKDVGKLNGFVEEMLSGQKVV